MYRLNRTLEIGTRGLLVVLVATWAVACAKSNSPDVNQKGKASKPIDVMLAPVAIGPLENTVEVTGTLYGDESATIRAQVSGQILAVSADVGDRIAPQHELAKMDPTDYQLAVNEREAALGAALAELGLTQLPGDNFDVTAIPTVRRAQAEADNAQAKLQRAQQLFERKPPLLSVQDYQDIQTASQVAASGLDVAKLTAAAQLATAKTRNSELQTARQQLRNTIVRAPDASADVATDRYAVVQRMISVGDYAKLGDPLFELVADDPIKYRASVPERLLGQVKVGQKIVLKVEALSQSFDGSITRITPVVDTATRTFMIEAEFKNATHHLQPGSFGRGVIWIGQEQGVVHLPKSSIVSFAGVDKVFTVKDGKAVEHRVTLIRQAEDWVAIRQTFEPSAMVVTTGAGNVTDGIAVHILKPQ